MVMMIHVSVAGLLFLESLNVWEPKLIFYLFQKPVILFRNNSVMYSNKLVILVALIAFLAQHVLTCVLIAP